MCTLAVAALGALAIDAARTATNATVPPMREAYRVFVEPSGKLLVADGAGGAGRIFRVNPATDRRTVVAGTGGRAFRLRARASRSSLGRVTDVASKNGIVYAIASSRLIKIDRRGKPVLLARFPAALSMAIAPDGSIYVTNDVGGRVLRFRRGHVQTVARGFSQPIGVAVTRDGAVYVTSGHDGGRVERLDRDGARTTVLGGLKLPVYLSTAPDGSLLVVDHVSHTSNGTLLRLESDGTVTTLSSGVVPAFSSAAEAPGGAIYVSSFLRPAVGRLESEKVIPVGTR